MAEVQLLGLWTSPFSERVKIGLKMKGVEYEYIEDDFRNKSALLLKYNPVHKKIPVLVHKGKPIAESLVIIEYIDEAFPGPSILPEDPYEKAQARFWAKFIDEKCLTPVWKACCSTGKEQERAKEEASEMLKLLENEIKDKKFFGGDTIGLVDIAANFLGYWIGICDEIVGLGLMTKEKFPNLCKWAHEFSNCSLMKQILHPKDKLTERLKSILEAEVASQGSTSNA